MNSTVSKISIICLNFILLMYTKNVSAFVMNHTSLTEFESLTSNQTNQVKKLNILFAHQSVGTYIMRGMVTINEDYNDGRFDYPIFPDPTIYPIQTPECSEWQSKGPGIGHMWAGGDANVSTYLSFLSQCSNIKIGIIKQGYVNIYNGMSAQKRFEDYKSKIETFRSSHPDVLILHSTIQVMKSGNGANNATNVERNKYRDLILQEYGDEFVFDIAELVSWYEGSQSTFTYNGSSYMKMDDRYAVASEPSGDSHPNQEGRVMLAKAFWVFLSHVASEISGDINTPPNVDAGEYKTLTLPNNSITLQGTISDDGQPNPPGSVSFRWSLVNEDSDVSIVSPTELNTVVTFPSKRGVYQLYLTGNDGSYTVNDTIQIIVNEANSNNPPIINAGEDRIERLPDTLFELRGTASDDGLPSESRLLILWNQLSGPSDVTFTNNSELITNIIIRESGEYIFELTVTDGELISTDTVKITLIAIDNENPSRPQNVMATAIETNEVKICWDPSHDNISIGGYDIYRDDQRIVSISDTCYIDTGLSSSTTYHYTIRAVDVNLNYSGHSEPAIVQTPPVNDSQNTVLEDLVIYPRADVYTSESQPDQNFGTYPTLSVCTGEITRHTFIGFNIPDIEDNTSIIGAKLKLVVNAGSYNSGGIIKQVVTQDDLWDESEISFNSPLAIRKEIALIANISRAVNEMDTIEVDAFNDSIIPGKSVTLFISTESIDGVKYYSKEEPDVNLQPKLILNLERTASTHSSFLQNNLAQSAEGIKVSKVTNKHIYINNLPFPQKTFISFTDIKGRRICSKYFTSSSSLLPLPINDILRSSNNITRGLYIMNIILQDKRVSFPVFLLK